MARTHLLIIDPQNDFCDTPNALRPVSLGQALPSTLAVPGSYQDMLRLSSLIRQVGMHLEGITVTLDSHPYFAIERTTFWTDAQGQALAPFSVVTLEDLNTGRAVPRRHKAQAAQYLQALEQGGKQALVVWPVHCVTGSWGHNIQTDLANSLNEWELNANVAVQKALKGQYPLAEHYGAFEAEVPVSSVPSTQFNEALAQQLTQGIDHLWVAGEASSHCVATSMRQLHAYMQRNQCSTQITLLTDCMSPVPGFEAQTQQFLDWAQSAGMRLSTAQALQQGMPT